MRGTVRRFAVLESNGRYLSGQPSRKVPAGFWSEDLGKALQFGLNVHVDGSWGFDWHQDMWAMGGPMKDTLRHFRTKYPPHLWPRVKFLAPVALGPIDLQHDDGRGDVSAISLEDALRCG